MHNKFSSHFFKILKEFGPSRGNMCVSEVVCSSLATLLQRLWKGTNRQSNRRYRGRIFTRATLCIARSLTSKDVRLTHAGIVSKPLNLSHNFLDHQVALSSKLF